MPRRDVRPPAEAPGTERGATKSTTKNAPDLGYTERPSEPTCDGPRLRVSPRGNETGLGEHIGHVDVVLYRRGSDLVAVVEMAGYAVGNDALETEWLRTSAAAILAAEMTPPTLR